MKETFGRAGIKSRLYGEFAQFYTQERCPWAPDNPRRVFNLAFESVYEKYDKNISEEQLLAEAYAVLGFPGSEPPGLFQTFDPARYRGRLSLEDHFVNLFVRKLRGRLDNAVKRNTLGRRLDRLGLCERNETDVAVLDLPQVLACLTARERAVVHLMYWENLSARNVGKLLALDHKTAKRDHDAAINKLRRAYGVEEKTGILPDSFPNRPRSL